MIRHHRRPPMPPRPPRGTCKWCADAILYPAGHKRAGEAEKRNWHPGCVTKYLIATQSQAQRKACWERDRGKCAGCGVVATKPGWRRGGTVYMYGYLTGEYSAVWPVTIDLWDADHITPLWSAPADMALSDRERWFGLENLQTLCRACHKAKSAREAKERAEVKRPALPLFGRAA